MQVKTPRRQDTTRSNADPTARVRKVIVWTFLIYALLVATHLGEFWPFSIYPMFSRGGHPWTRSVVREVSAQRIGDFSVVYTLGELPGTTVALSNVGINQNDIANFIAKTDGWDSDRKQAIRKVFGKYLERRNLVIYSVEGRLGDGNSVETTFKPFVYLTPDTSLFNPALISAP